MMRSIILRGKILVTVTEGTDVQTAEVEVGDICDANDCQKKSMDLPNEKWKLKARQSQPRTCGRWCERSRDVNLCSMHSAHANLTINMQPHRL